MQLEIYKGTQWAFGQGLENGITNNAWGFYGARLDGSKYRIFNDSSSTTGDSTVLPSNVSRPNSFIGKSNWSTNGLFDKSIGILAIYNTALNDGEITEFYNLYKARYE